MRGLTEEAEAAEEAGNEAAARRVGDLQRRASQARERNLLELFGGATRSSLGLLGGGQAGARCSISDRAAPFDISTRLRVHVEYLHPRSRTARAVRWRRQPHELPFPSRCWPATISWSLSVRTTATGFSITGIGDPDGGEIAFGTAPAPGTTITLLRRTEGIRETAFVDGGPFRASAINAELDRIMLLIQEDREEHGERCVATRRNPPSTSPCRRPPRANKLLGFDSAGSPVAFSAAELPTSGDASGALVTPSGATTARMLGEHLAARVNVRDFGALGDGITDDEGGFCGGHHRGAKSGRPGLRAGQRNAVCAR